MKNDVDLKYPVLIILITGIISVLTTIITFNDRSLLSIVWSSIVGKYVSWILITSIYYLISLFLNSSGSFKRILEFISYGYVPAIFESVIYLIVCLILRDSFDITSQNSLFHLKILKEMLLHNSLFQAAMIIGILFGLWTLYINVYAVMYARNLSKRSAFITAFIPFFFSFVVIILLYFIITSTFYNN